MIRFYFYPTPIPAKVTLLLEGLGLAYEVVPGGVRKAEQDKTGLCAINSSDSVRAIVDTKISGSGEAQVFESDSILLYPGDKTKRLIGTPAHSPVQLLWRFFMGTGIGQFSRQSAFFPARGAQVNTICDKPLSARSRATLPRASICRLPGATIR